MVLLKTLSTWFEMVMEASMTNDLRGTPRTAACHEVQRREMILRKLILGTIAALLLTISPALAKEPCLEIPTPSYCTTTHTQSLQQIDAAARAWDEEQKRRAAETLGLPPNREPSAADEQYLIARSKLITEIEMYPHPCTGGDLSLQFPKSRLFLLHLVRESQFDGFVLHSQKLEAAAVQEILAEQRQIGVQWCVNMHSLLEQIEQEPSESLMKSVAGLK
jgi:hypothetical protein